MIYIRKYSLKVDSLLNEKIFLDVESLDYGVSKVSSLDLDSKKVIVSSDNVDILSHFKKYYNPNFFEIIGENVRLLRLKDRQKRKKRYEIDLTKKTDLFIERIAERVKEPLQKVYKNADIKVTYNKAEIYDYQIIIEFEVFAKGRQGSVSIEFNAEKWEYQFLKTDFAYPDKILSVFKRVISPLITSGKRIKLC